MKTINISLIVLLLSHLAQAEIISNQPNTLSDRHGPTPRDTQIAEIVKASDQVDIEGGLLAKSKTKDPEISSLAGMMVDDHGKNKNELTSVMKQLEMKPEATETSKGIVSEGKADREKLKSKSGKAFDDAYIAYEVNMHSNVLNTLDQDLIPNAHNPELKKFLQDTRSVVSAHLDHAKMLQADRAKKDSSKQ